MSRSNCRLLLTALATCLIVAGQVEAEEGSPQPTIDFVRDVRPILESHCLGCHGPDKQESNYRLDRKGVALKGGDYGDAPIVPGKSGQSPLIAYITGGGELTMPPDGDGLSEGEVATLKAWIDQGATWPGDAIDDPAVTHWAFQPLVRPSVPAVENQSPFVRNEVDAFVLAKLQANDLRPSPEADRRTLIRRLYFDVIGLPPAPEEIREFVDDSGPTAYERLVERLLASPHFG